MLNEGGLNPAGRSFRLALGLPSVVGREEEDKEEKERAAKVITNDHKCNGITVLAIWVRPSISSSQMPETPDFSLHSVDFETKTQHRCLRGTGAPPPLPPPFHPILREARVFDAASRAAWNAAAKREFTSVRSRASEHARSVRGSVR